MLDLRYFRPIEFVRGDVDWFPKMSPRLLVLADTMRHQWGKPIHISRDNAALGRNLGASHSQHNIDRWKEVRAMDIQPEGLDTPEDAHAFHMLALDLGITGIGFYPHWHMPGFHIDVRADAAAGSPATWGRLLRNGVTVDVSIRDAIECLA